MRRAAWVLALALATPARADILLDGSQHIGDAESVTFTPSDPVRLDEFSSSPSRFDLTQAITVTAVRLGNLIAASPAPLSANQPFQAEIDGATLPGTYSAGVLTLSTPIGLATGVHTIAIDPGCLRSGIQRFGVSCRPFDDEFDIGFSAITLVTASPTQTTLSQNLTRRRHLGDTNDFSNDNFAGSFYPDAPEGGTLDIPFTLGASLLLSEIRFYRLRDVGATNQVLSRGQVSIVNVATGVVSVIGSLSANANPLILPASLSLAAGNYRVRVQAGQMKNSTSDPDKGLDDLRWNDILLLFGIDATATPGRFNAVDHDQNAVTGILRTKIAGIPLTDVDITALTAGALFPGYTGSVAVDLLDASDDSGTTDAYGCLTSWPVRQSLGTLVFAAGDAGRKALAAEIADAYPRARLRVVDTTLGVGGCSTDAFAVRPATFALAVTDQDWETPGTSRTLSALTSAATPIHKAGRTFTIRASAVNAHGVLTPGYTGSPTVLAASPVLGAVVGEARADVWTTSGGTARSDSARYNEAGAFALEVSDTSFASVDAADPGADRQVGPVSISVGRFVPDHFNATYNAPEFTPACGTFTYSGQRFQYATGLTPVATLAAVAYGAPPYTTRNYTGALYKLPAGFLPGVSTYAALGGHALDASTLPNPDNTLVDAGNGLATLSLLGAANGFVFTRPAAPEDPFDAEIAVTRGSVVDSDGVTTDVTGGVQFGQAAAGLGVAFTGTAAAKRVVFGRLAVDNAHGSERLPLDVPLRAEYWEVTGGAHGFIHNGADNCTALAGQITLGGPMFDGSPNPNDTSILVQPATMVAGNAFVRLAAPFDTGTASVKATIAALLPWLLTEDASDADTLYNNEPVGLATFGLHRSDDRRVYQREVIGP